MKAICFKCHFVGVGVAASRCPGCGYPLIVSTETSRLGMNDIEQVFEATSKRSMTAPLPGVIFKVPKPFLKRPASGAKARAASAGGGTTIADARPKRRLVGEVVAASAAFVGGLLITLAAFGAL